MRPPLPFGKYLLLERISVGGMAEVFKAKSFGVEGFEKIIAIKRILPSMAEDEEFVEMFIDEAKIAGQLSHANIGQIFELGKIESSHFIAMEYIWGKDFLQIQNRLKKLGQKPVIPMACFLAVKVCEGLDYAHRRKDPTGRPLQIIHRDVSPQNVLVSYEGEVKVIDFGIAKAAVRSSRTQAGVLKGKFGYMSPEQVRGLPLNRRSDIFAIGTLLHEALTGEKLFANDNDFTTLERVRDVEVVPPSHKNPDVTPALDRIVMRALHRDVEARYQWGNELQEDLQQYMVKTGTMFSSKQLALWMKDAFAADLTRERQQLETFKRMGREAVRPAPPVDTQHHHESAEQTEISEEPVAKPLPMPMPMPMRKVAGGHGGFGDEAPTEIFDGDDAPLGNLHSVDAPIPIHLPQAAPTTSLRASQPLALPLPLPVPPAPTEPIAQPVADTLPVPLPAIPVAPAIPEHVPVSAPIPISVTGSVPSGRMTLQGITAVQVPEIRQRAPRPSTGRVVAWVSGACVLVAGLLIGAYLLGTRVINKPADEPVAASAPSKATLVVAAGDGGTGQVFINGVARGELRAGEPLTVELTPGDVDVVVKRPGAIDCAQKVTVDASAAKVVTCRFQVAGRAKLQLLVATPGATVYVDKQEITAEAAAEPLELTAGTPHEITVKKDGFEPQTVTITLPPNTVQTKPFELLPAEPPAKPERKEPKKLPPTNPAAIPVNTPPPVAPDPIKEPKHPPPAPIDEPIAVVPSKPTQAFDDHAGGYLVADSQPKARVLVDGVDTGKSTPSGKIPVSSGKHKVTFIVGDQPFNYNIMVEPGQDYRLSKSLPVELR